MMQREDIIQIFDFLSSSFPLQLSSDFTGVSVCCLLVLVGQEPTVKVSQILQIVHQNWRLSSVSYAHTDILIDVLIIIVNSL